MISDIWILLIYKLTTLLSGVFSIFLGYKLFIKGIFVASGDLDISVDTKKLTLTSAAPGTFFTLFGAIIICIAIFKGFTIEHGSNKNQQQTEAQPPSLPSEIK